MYCTFFEFHFGVEASKHDLFAGHRKVDCRSLFAPRASASASAQVGWGWMLCKADTVDNVWQ